MIKAAGGVVTLVAALLGSVMVASPASAATQADYNLAYCYSGSYVGSGSNVLDNGTLSFGWCKTSTNKATTITVKDFKRCGTNITATFGYEWVNSGGTTTAGRHWDQTGSVTIQASQTWGARFKRDPAEAKPSSTTPCLRGLMKANGVVYSTRVVCP
jgi:hypothetical protein